jgi:hypothetical protein
VMRRNVISPGMAARAWTAACAEFATLTAERNALRRELQWCRETAALLDLLEARRERLDAEAAARAAERERDW